MEGLNQESQTHPTQAQVGGADEQEKRAQEEQAKRDVFSRLLDSAARERLSRIALVSPQRSQQVETILLRMVQSGQLRGRVTEEQLIQLLEQMEEAQGKAAPKKASISYQRKRDIDDDFDF